jgi:hypothetical protein
MQFHERIASARRSHALTWIMVLGMVAVLSAPASAQSWYGYGQGSQHTALSTGPSQLPQVIRWSNPVDLQAQHSSNGDLNAHYGSPAITAHNTVIIPVKTGADGGFMVTAVSAGSGNVLWTMDTDYELPPHNWVMPMGLVLSGADLTLAVPGAGGTVLVRTAPDLRRGQVNRLSFLGMSSYNQDPASFDATIQINTPLTYDSDGNLYFGYYSTGDPLPGYPDGIPSGLARITRKGVGSFITATAMSGDPNITKVANSCAPALSNDGSSVYVAVNQSNFSYGYLCKVASATLQPQAHVYLKDPNTGSAGLLSDDSTGTPTVGPDGDVYYGVLESNFPGHHARGWLLHFDAALQTTKTPGSFGWDDSPSVVPTRLVPSYLGSSSYLVLTKYNDYSDPGIGGTGLNKVAVLDPNATEPDPIVPTVLVMKEVITVLGVTPNEGQPGVREWCINSAAIDEGNKCAVINSEDGHVYRWSFATNKLTQGLDLAPATGEPYTPTVIGPDGAVYAINDGKLFCCISGTGTTSNGPAPDPGSNLAGALPPIPAGAIPVALLGAVGLLLVACAGAWRLIGTTRLQPLYVRVKNGR